MTVVKINALWCSGCLVMNKIWQKIAKDFPNLDIENLDYDFDNNEVKKYNIGNKLPVVIFFDEQNKEIQRIIGETSYEILYKFIEGNNK
ncbi:MAG: thioredoxin family protein [Bacilli bacterium]|nr:thioredoxin family protein [Bacilli bacterium]